MPIVNFMLSLLIATICTTVTVQAPQAADWPEELSGASPSPSDQPWTVQEPEPEPSCEIKVRVVEPSVPSVTEIEPPVTCEPAASMSVVVEPAGCGMRSYYGGSHFRAVRPVKLGSPCWDRVKACLQESHWGYPEEFEERPFGACVFAHVKTQVVNGLAAQMVLYRYDFCDETLGEPQRLNPRGVEQLNKIVGLMAANSCPLIIEPTPCNPDLDRARRDFVLQLLQASACDVPESRVVVCKPDDGLRGEEAFEIDQNMLQQTRTSAGSTFSSPPGVTTGALGLPSGTAGFSNAPPGW
ncbi:MAG TPA: hypothetical protein VMY42_20985 [Thermoguttaceae bacterium]|nr:hypothetical protein [Thermoguttaceae bacterium]